MKTAVVSAMFPELKGGNIWKTGKGSGATAKVAITRAFADVLRQVSGRHIHQIKCTVAILESASELGKFEGSAAREEPHENLRHKFARERRVQGYSRNPGASTN